MPKIKVSLGIGLSNCRQEDILDIDEDEWGYCSNEEEREKLMYEIAEEWASSYIDLGAALVE